MSDTRKRRLVNVMISAVALAATGSVFVACGSPGAAAVQVSARDSGSQIRIHVGQTLSLDLGARARGPWALSYPRSLVSLARAARDKGQFRLLARHVGEAKIVAFPLGGCGFPALHGPARKCPLTSRMSQVGDSRTRPFMLTLQIVK